MGTIREPPLPLWRQVYPALPPLPDDPPFNIFQERVSLFPCRATLLSPPDRRGWSFFFFRCSCFVCKEIPPAALTVFFFRISPLLPRERIMGLASDGKEVFSGGDGWPGSSPFLRLLCPSWGEAGQKMAPPSLPFSFRGLGNLFSLEFFFSPQN